MTPKYHINLFWSEAGSDSESPPGGGCCMGCHVPDLRSCVAFDDTPAQALAEVEGAMEAWLAVACEEGCQSRSRAIMRQSSSPPNSASNIGELS
jgi:predicted RNase H-like HicB family nuclease